MVQDGSSIVMCARTWQGVYRYCTKLAQSMNLSNTEQYEVTGMSLCVDGEVVTCTCSHEEMDIGNHSESGMCIDIGECGTV